MQQTPNPPSPLSTPSVSAGTKPSAATEQNAAAEQSAATEQSTATTHSAATEHSARQEPGAPWLEFVNHASVLLSDGQHAVLTDPWFFGDIFHQGWSLLVDTPDDDIRRVLAQTTHIWLSHEHPDHFSPPFFRRYREQILRQGITILFQRTRDRRLVSYLRQLGLPVVELADGEPYTLNPAFVVRIVKADLYDSALLADIAGVRVFNLNDCPLHSHATLGAFAERYGQCDLLLTQFSYAAWKGGKANRSWRQKAARHKLATIQAQMAVLQPAATLLFASFVRFANQLNSYMNDAVNQPAEVVAALAEQSSQPLFLAPGERQPLAALRQHPESLAFWQQQFSEIATKPLLSYRTEDNLASLQQHFADYQQRLWQANNRVLLWAARRWLALRPFDVTHLYLVDLGLTVRIELLGRLEPADDAAADLALHSSSLAYLFRHEFGFDTLFVNGCFEELRSGGFERFAKCFAIGNLNASGVFIRFGSLLRLDVIRLMLGKLNTVRSNLRQNQTPPER